MTEEGRRRGGSATRGRGVTLGARGDVSREAVPQKRTRKEVEPGFAYVGFGSTTEMAALLPPVTASPLGTRVAVALGLLPSYVEEEVKAAE